MATSSSEEEKRGIDFLQTASSDAQPYTSINKIKNDRKRANGGPIETCPTVDDAPEVRLKAVSV